MQLREDPGLVQLGPWTSAVQRSLLQLGRTLHISMHRNSLSLIQRLEAGMVSCGPQEMLILYEKIISHQ